MKKIIAFGVILMSFSFAHAEKTLLETVMQDRNSSPSKMDTTNESRRARQASAAEYLRNHEPTERIYIEERVIEPRDPSKRVPVETP
ncbi:hypothetical protein [Bdellovibrio sp. HCB288]|uniref:hypothetical protein n=1 Tax=Bdellovibrio sp. HCB288 TaxID=3394355 RepID=UPI0039B5F7C9